MKTCHHCNAEFESGLTCPSCRGFVPDPPPPDDDDLTPSFPSWAKVADEPDAATSGNDALLPAAYPAWAKQPDLDGDVGPVAPPAGWPTPDGAAAAPTPGDAAPTPASWSVGTSFGAPGGPTGAYNPDPVAPGFTKPPSFSLTPMNLAFGLGAVFIVVVLAAFVLRPSSPTPGQVASDIAGSCFTYNADHSHLDRPVSCDDQHDGTVLAFATDQTKCPDGTDAILTTSSDTFGTHGVLCVHEQK